jgi:hypothetical protein
MNYKWGSEVKEKGSDGMSNAAIETFRAGNIMSGFVRELLQNSQDARLDNVPLKIRIRLFTIKKSDIPEFENQWLEIYDSVRSRWMKNYQGFFDKADKVLDGDMITVLEYSDYNCSGLSGSDDEDSGSFSACVLSEGNSVEKSNEAGGSYGIGKNAVFGLSGIRTVFYSSLNTNGEYIFQGVSKLASYVLNGIGYNSRVYLGNDDGRLSSIRKRDSIPEFFRRESCGLSQFVLGADLEKDWIDGLINLVIDNYFILLYNSKLEFEFHDLVDGRTEKFVLNHSNFEQYAEASYGKTLDTEKGMHVWPKIIALKEVALRKDFRDLKGNKLEDSFIVHFTNDIKEGNNLVTYTRRGMCIYTDRLHSAGGIGYLNLVGVFYSENKKINSFLRLMEPAAHDAWNNTLLYDRIKNEEELNWALGLQKEIKEFIRECAKKYLKEVSRETHSITEVDELLRIGSSPSSVFRSGVSRSGYVDETKETALKTGRKYQVRLSFSGLGENLVEGEFIDKPEKEKKEGDNTKRNKDSRTGGNSGGVKSKKNKSIPTISYSSILLKETEFKREYRLVLKSDKIKTADLEIDQAGDRGSKLKPELLSVSQNSISLDYETTGEVIVIKGVAFVDGKAILNVEIKSLSKAGIILQPVKIY